MTYWLTNVYCANAVIFDAGFILVQDFLRGFNPNLMIGFSFNRYYHPQNDPNPRFEFRCNFSDDTNGKSEAERRLNSFITNGRISRFTGWVPFQRREDVVKSAEIASSWSLAFFEHLSQNQNTASDFNSDRMMFLTRFIPIILQEHEVDAKLLTSDIDDDYVNRLKALSRVCKTSTRYPFPQNPSLDFLERVIHFFMNCVSSNDVEGAFRFHLMWVNWLGDLSRRSRKSLLSKIRKALA